MGEQKGPESASAGHGNIPRVRRPPTPALAGVALAGPKHCWGDLVTPTLDNVPAGPGERANPSWPRIASSIPNPWALFGDTVVPQTQTLPQYFHIPACFPETGP